MELRRRKQHIANPEHQAVAQGREKFPALPNSGHDARMLQAPDLQPVLPTEKRAPIRLATPTAQEVEVFRNLYREHFSVNLEPSEALTVATHYLHIFQILTDE